MKRRDCFQTDWLLNLQPRVVGFFQFNTSPQPPGYITYLSSALQALKRGKASPRAASCHVRAETRTFLIYALHLTRPKSSMPSLSGADFHGVVRFGVVTSKQVAEAISLTDDESVYLHRRFNSSLVRDRPS